MVRYIIEAIVLLYVLSGYENGKQHPTAAEREEIVPAQNSSTFFETQFRRDVP